MNRLRNSTVVLADAPPSVFNQNLKLSFIIQNGFLIINEFDGDKQGMRVHLLAHGGRHTGLQNLGRVPCQKVLFKFNFEGAFRFCTF